MIIDASWRLSWLRDYLFSEKIIFGNFKDVPPKHITNIVASTICPSTTWKDLDWLRKEWDRPLIIKGILSKEDARIAVDHGVDGIIVSNHAGRQLESAPGTLEVLPEIVDVVEDSVEVYFDGGIRRGGDVLKAIALGARACLIGRAYMWGLTIGGEEGVVRVLEILRDEIDRTMALIGRSNLSEVDRSAVRM
jgi:L-lactate dehydrogenase (cytochrome)